MELAAELAVLVACNVAGAVLFVMFTAPHRRLPPGDPPDPPVMAGLVPTVLVAFIVLAGGTALTGAGTVNAGTASVVLAAIGITVLAAVGLLVGRATLHALRSPRAEEALVTPSPTLLVMAWVGAALALGSWLLAIGAVLVALLASVRIERGSA